MKVSVLMLAYNHEDFIAQALSSVLMQEVNFDYEIVVGEDFSTDATRSVLLDFLEKYPGKIKVILHDRNVGMHANFASVLKACSGEYVAILEADDFWTDSGKLQKQVDLMERDKSFSECFHKVTTIYQDGKQAPHDFPVGLMRAEYGLDDIVSEFFIPTLSVLFRRSVVSNLPAEFYDVSNPDWFIHILCAEKGRVAFIDEVMGVYRVHEGGVWSSKKRSEILEKTIVSARVVNRYLSYRYARVLVRRIVFFHIEVIKICVRDLDFVLAAKHFSQLVLCGFSLFLNKFIGRA